MDEKELLHAATSNADAFAELYRLHVTRVYRYHMVHVGSAKDAEDLTSQTFMAALKEFNSSHENGSFATWLMGIAAKKRLNNVWGKRRELPGDAILYYQSAGLPTDKAAMRRQEMDATTRALKQISPDHAEAVILTFFSDLSVPEVSRLLKKNTSTTPKFILRGIQELRTRSTLTPVEATTEDQETMDANPEDEILADKLNNLASQIIPDPLFIDELEKILMASHLPKTKRNFSLQQFASLGGWVLLIAAGVFLLYWRVTPNSKSVNPIIANTGNTTSTVVTAPRSSPTIRATSTSFPTLEYIVQAGDTCTYIAERFGVTINQLITLNDLNDSCDIYIDQTLFVPIPTPTPTN